MDVGAVLCALHRWSRLLVEMAVLLAVLLALGLPMVLTSDRIRRTAPFQCHVCESENSFNCSNPVTCGTSEQYCVAVAIRILERFFLVSKQCSKSCPTEPLLPPPDPEPEPVPPQPQSFVLIKPMPFFYTHCCKWALCNDVNRGFTMFKEQPGSASERSFSYLALLLPGLGLVVLMTAALGDLSLL